MNSHRPTRGLPLHRLTLGRFTVAWFTLTWFAFAGINSAFLPALSAQSRTAQHSTELETVVVKGNSYFIQRTRRTQLRLTPNTCFFDGKGLSAQGKGKQNQAAPKLNGSKSFRSIKGFKAQDSAPANSVSWYLHIEATGTATLTLNASDPTAFGWKCAEQEGSFSTNQKLKFTEPGIYRLHLFSSKTSSASVEAIDIRGSAMKNAGVVRTRWRPSAAHTRFTTSGTETPIQLWVMEMDGVPGDASFYAPMTTPFGYFGSSWTKDGRPTGLNFSIWSYSRNAKEPPVERLSHLIAIGNPNASFGHFGHEGTGVKVRDWNPFTNWQGQRCVYALRLVPGNPYDTYYGYYFDEKTETWRLFAAGRKYQAGQSGKKRSKRRLKRGASKASLTVGSFVEVPGPPQRQRTGHIVRSMRYRGFMRDTSGQWHAVDQMKGEGKPGALQNRHRQLTEDGRFEMSMGGVRQEGANPSLHLEKPTAQNNLPWMKPEALNVLLSSPTTVEASHLTFADGKASLDLKVLGAAQDAHATIYYGSEEGLTIAKRWAHSHKVKSIHEGSQRITWPAQVAPTNARVLVENTKGRFWSDTTVKLVR